MASAQSKKPEESALEAFRSQRRFSPRNYAGSSPETIIPRAFGGLFKLLTRIFIFFLTFAILFIVVVFFTNCNRLGTCGVALVKVSSALQTGFSQIEGKTGVVSNFWNYILTGGASEIGKTDFGTVTPENSKKFIELETVKVRGIYAENEPITNIKSNLVLSGGLVKDTKVTIACEFKDYDGEISYELPFTEPGPIQYFTIPQNSRDTEKFPIICNFNDGIKLSNQDAPVGSVAAKTGRMAAIYESTAESKWRPYILSADDIKKLKDPAQDFKDDPAYTRTAGIDGMKTELQYESAIELEIKSDSNMPFQEGRFYTLTVALKEQNDLSGNLYSLDKLTLKVPSNVELETGSNNCDFEPQTTDENGKIYTAKKSFLKRINDECTKEGLQRAGISRSECIRFYKTDIEANCRMAFNIEQGTNIPTFLNFGSYAEYSYELENTFTITIKKGL